VISNKHKFIFVHIPKCAGTSIEFSLNGSAYVKWDAHNKIWVQHATAEQIKKLYCQNYEDYFSFTFTRNPWDRAISDYFWMKKDLSIEDSFKNYLLLENNFNTPNLRYPHLNMTGRGDHILAQSDFILNSNGDRIVDFIGTFENLQEDFNIVCDKIGIPRKQLPHTNKTKHRNYTEYYDEETKQIVAQKYAKDIEYFGYKFGE
jgi:chondroitin 4-sulfotransferase 11